MRPRLIASEILQYQIESGSPAFRFNEAEADRLGNLKSARAQFPALRRFNEAEADRLGNLPSPPFRAANCASFNEAEADRLGNQRVGANTTSPPICFNEAEADRLGNLLECGEVPWSDAMLQ